MKKAIKRILSFFLVLVTIASLAVPAFAASGSINDTAKEELPNQSNISIRGYGYKTSGTIKCYTDSSLKNRGSAWIDLRTDECYIQKIANGGKALYIKFPIGGGRYISRWFSTKDFLGIESIGGKFPVYRVTKQLTTYKRSNGGAKYGYAGVGDKIYLINMNSEFVTIIYPLSAGGYKIGHVKYNSFQNCTEIIGNDNVSSAFVHPMNNYQNYTQWGDRPSYRNGSSTQYHVGVDYMSNSDRNIYAFADGIVISSGWQNANGNYVLIEHSIPDSNGNMKTVYSFYGHLSKRSVSAGQTVSAGTTIGEVGKTGSSGNGVDHLHFAIIDYKWASGGVYGYVTKFSGNKVTYDNVTYYSPYYIIEHGCLP